MKIRAIDYGKRSIPVYRFSAAPLEGVPEIPESAFRGRANRLMAAEVDVRVLGENFAAAYTEGDNSAVVATDSMKNFVLRGALEWGGATLEHLVRHLAEGFLRTYPHMERIEVGATEIPFLPELVPDGDGGFRESDVLHGDVRGDRGAALVEMALGPDGAPVALDHRCGRLEMRLVKTTGSAFAAFVRDEHATLPERTDRPLYIHMDVAWRYRDLDDGFSGDPARYVAAEQMRDLCAATFEDFVSMSIQHLLFEMGRRALARFPQLAEVAFEAQNRLWDPAFEDEADPLRMVRTDPRPPFGDIGLVVTPDDVEGDGLEAGEGDGPGAGEDGDPGSGDAGGRGA